MYCKICGFFVQKRSSYCKNCGAEISGFLPKTNTEKIQAIEDSGYNLGVSTLFVFLAWCSLHIYFYALNFPSSLQDKEYFWPLKYSQFSNYDLSELEFYIFVPATILSLVNYFVKKKDLSPLGLIQTYDLNYKPTVIPVLTGVLVLLLSLGYFLKKNANVHYFKVSDFQQEEIHFKTISFFIFIIIARISLLLMTISLAKKLNRSPANWGVSAFIAPAITLIILGQKRKLLPY